MFKTLLTSFSAALMLVFLAPGAEAQNGTPLSIIVDTDMESDVDDVGALAMVHALADLGELNLLGVMVCAKNNWSTLCADRINTYFGGADLPLGQLKGPGVDRGSAYARQVAEEFPGKYASAATVPDAVDQYRSILAGQPDNSVVLLTIGYTTNLRDLLASDPDEHSVLDGQALVEKKVRLWMCMGGQFPSGYEANIRWDAAASVEAIGDWPTEIIFAGWEIGLMDTGGQILSLPASSPVRRAYQLFGKIPHKSWDQVAVLYAARGLDDGASAFHWELSAPGRIVIDAAGNNTWTADPEGTHRHLIQKSTNTVIAQEIDSLMMHLPAAGDPEGYSVTVSNTSPLAGAEVTVTAQLVDESGISILESGRTVSWSATNGGSFNNDQTVTDESGKANVIFTTSGMAQTEHVVTAVDVDDESLAGSSPTIITLDNSTESTTIAYHHFNEEPGTSDSGNPIINYGVGGSDLNLTNTGGPDGRNNSGTGGYGAPAYPGFGAAFDILASGDGTYHSGAGGSSTGGGLTTATPVLQSALQGGDGAFTYEALINLSGGITDEQNILSHDGTDNASRGFLFRVTGGQLSLYPGTLVSGPTVEMRVDIPTTGDHAFEAGKWFHVAVSYTGEEGTPGNVRFYWTALDSGVSQGNEIGTSTLAADLRPEVGNLFGVGTTTRSPFRFEVRGLVDEVRISSIARQPDEFVFLSAPSPFIDTDGDGIPDDWEIENGLDPEIPNIGTDSDKDGIADLMEFALDLDPQVPDLSGLPVVDNEDGFLTLTASRNSAAGHLLFEVEVTDSLDIWDSGSAHVTVLRNTSTFLKARDNILISEAPGRFIRLKVSVPE